MPDTNFVGAQETDGDGDELITALEASHRGTEATSDKGGEDNSDVNEEEDETTDSGGEDKGSEENGENGGEKTEKEKAAEEEAAAKAASEAAAAEDSQELKNLLRQATQKNEILEARLGRLEKGQEKRLAAEADEEDEDGNKKGREDVELSAVEVLSNDIATVQKDRSESFNLMLEIMEESESFKDVKSVCSQANFNDIVGAVAEDVARKNGISATEAFLTVELNIWQQPNPFKYMYGLVKKYHPSYVESNGGKKEEEKGGEKGEKSVSDTTKNAPGSVAGMGGGSANKAGWTAAKIDALSEEDISKVPKDIYEKYMNEELD